MSLTADSSCVPCVVAYEAHDNQGMWVESVELIQPLNPYCLKHNSNLDMLSFLKGLVTCFSNKIVLPYFMKTWKAEDDSIFI